MQEIRWILITIAHNWLFWTSEMWQFLLFAASDQADLIFTGARRPKFSRGGRRHRNARAITERGRKSTKFFTWKRITKWCIFDKIFHLKKDVENHLDFHTYSWRILCKQSSDDDNTRYTKIFIFIWFLRCFRAIPSPRTCVNVETKALPTCLHFHPKKPLKIHSKMIRKRDAEICLIFHPFWVPKPFPKWSKIHTKSPKNQ